VIKRSIARRYAQALMELAEEDAADIGDKLVKFAELLRANPLLKEVLISPAFRLDERKKVFSLILERLGWGPPLDRFLWYLTEHRRMAWLEVIAEVFVGMVDEREGKTRVQVTSSRPLDKKMQAELLKALTDGLGAKVVLEHRVDESLLAGLTLRIGDLVIDGSLKTQLESLRERLVQRVS
jgi:F-type H+-transporting ATPase subunit delta